MIVLVLVRGAAGTLDSEDECGWKSPDELAVGVCVKLGLSAPATSVQREVTSTSETKSVDEMSRLSCLVRVADDFSYNEGIDTKVLEVRVHSNLSDR